MSNRKSARRPSAGRRMARRHLVCGVILPLPIPAWLIDFAPLMEHLPLVFLLAQAAPEAPSPNPLVSFLPLIFIFVIFYFLLIRPQQKKQKEHAKLVAGLKTGDRVITTAGIHGLITNVKENTVTIKVADNVKIEFDKAAVVTVSRPAEGAES